MATSGVTYVERDIRRQFAKVAGVYPIVAIVGARQAGKTTFLKHHLGVRGNYLLFDDPVVRELFEDDIKKFEVQYLTQEVNVLDEIQYAHEPGQTLKYLADTGRKLWITASSEALLSSRVLSYLVGRVSVLRLYPFSLPEFLQAKGQRAFTDHVLARMVWEHASFGGYPKVVETTDTELKETILRDLYETMLMKDMVRLFSIEDVTALERCVRYLAATAGGVLSYGNMSQEMGLSFQTIKKYLDAMELSYLIRRVKPFFRNRTTEIKKEPKVYFIDTGLRTLAEKSRPANLSGSMFENYVFTELVKAGFEPRYWRVKTGAEVDFVIEGKDGVIPMEVKLTSNGKVESGLKAFIEMYKPKRAFVVFYDGEHKKERYKGTEIVFCNVLDMLKQKGGIR